MGNPAGYTVNDAFSFALPIKQGYVFLGWTVEGGLTSIVATSDFSVSIGTTGNLYLSAHWEKIPENAPPPASAPTSHILKTGDNGGVMLWIALMIIAGIGMAGTALLLLIVSRRQRKHK